MSRLGKIWNAAWATWPRRLLAGAVLLALLAGIALEIFVRAEGMAAFPVYLADPQIGYIVKPNQQGIFLHRNRWIFNEHSMGNGPFRPEGRRNVLVLGDSIVLGGNPIDQEDRIGPRLERELGAPWAVWSSAAQSWSSVNEAVYLRREPEAVGKMEWLVWVMNDGDFQGLSRWRSDLFNPRRRPLWQSLYVFEKQVWLVRVEPRLPPALRLAPPDPLDGVPYDARIPDFKANLQALKQSYPRLRILLVWFPEVWELHPPPGDFYLKTSAILKTFSEEENLSFVDLAQAPGWDSSCYRDLLHPNAAGNRVFARIVKKAMDSAAPPAP